MTLLQQLKADQLQARKNRDQAKTAILTTLVAEVVSVGFNDGKRATSDLEAITVIKKFIKNVNEVIAASDGHNVSLYTYERDIYDSYIPNQLSQDEIVAIAKQIISTIDDPSIKSLGFVMKVMKQNHAGLYDGKVASTVIRSLLA